MAQIRVTGTGHTSSAPDEASFNFSCAGHADEAPAALAQATAAAQSVLALLESVGVDEHQRGVQHARVHPRTRWVNDREVRDGWDAHAGVECTIDDAVAAFDLLERSAELADVSVHGPQWRVRSDNPAHDASRRLAVEDARGKAQSFADAAGLALGNLIELIEGGSTHGGPMMRTAMMSESAPLEAADQDVRASVTLVYEAS